MATPNLTAINSLGGGGLKLPLHDYEAFAYIGATNNVSTITGYRGGSAGIAVGTLTFTYAAAGAANDDLVSTITLSLPTANY